MTVSKETHSLARLLVRRLALNVVLSAAAITLWYGVSSYLGSYEGGKQWVAAARTSVALAHRSHLDALEQRARALASSARPVEGLVADETYVRIGPDGAQYFGAPMSPTSGAALVASVQQEKSRTSDATAPLRGFRWEDGELYAVVAVFDGPRAGVLHTRVTQRWLATDTALTAAEVAYLDTAGEVRASSYRDEAGARLGLTLKADSMSSVVAAAGADGEPGVRTLVFDGAYRGAQSNGWHAGDSTLEAFSSATPMASLDGSPIGAVWITVPLDVMVGWAKRGIAGTVMLGILLAMLTVVVIRLRVGQVIRPLEVIRARIVALAGFFASREREDASSISLGESLNLSSEFEEIDEVAADLRLLETKVSESAALEAQLRRAQKMEAVGTLAGGLAHDFNNLLNVLVLNAESLRDEQASGGLTPQDHEEILSDILEACAQAQSLTHQLLALSRDQGGREGIFDLNGAVAGATRLLRRLIPEPIALHVDLTEGAMGIRGLDNSLHQVVMNLVLNACDAIEDRGHIRVRTSRLTVDAPRPCVEGVLSPGEHAVLSVADTGHGLDPAQIPELFEPFVTRKGEGGTGLGLAVVRHSVLRGFGGAIEVVSTPGEGTEFRVMFPIAGDAPLEVAAPATSRPGLQVDGCVVGLVEDNEHVRRSLRRTLESIGCTVHGFGSGSQCIQWLAHHDSEPLDLLVSDVMMPEMNGPETVLAARAIRPALKVLFVTGYAGSTVGDAGLSECEVLQKPVSRDTLRTTIAAVLADSPADASPSPDA